MRRDWSLTTWAEVALAAVTLAAVAGMHRLFADGGWFVPLLINAIAAHATVTICRQRGLALPMTGAVMALGAIAVTSWTSYGSTTTFGVPTADTASSMQADLSQAWTLYKDVVAPAPAETGFVLASALALWAIAYVADWAAFRLWVPFEATLPSGTLFLFTALLGTSRGRGWAVALFAGALLGFLLLHRTARQDTALRWVDERRFDGHRSLLTAGTSLAVVAVVAGSVLGPLLPGADAPGVLDPRDAGGDSTRITISPLVDIRSRLVNQSSVEVFTVRSPEPSYWRLTSLDRFDGRIWSSSGSFERAKGALPDSLPTTSRVQTFEQTFNIGALAAIWLPNAFKPRAVSAEDIGVLYEADSATLIIDRDAETSNNLTYSVTSASPRITAADLAGGDGDTPAEIQSRYLELPTDFSPSVRQLAAELTAPVATPYAAARALQDHLRSFAYDLNVPAGHGSDALEQFLFTTRRGYCEQFAGSFAAMARSVGLPARVAVGFTQGERDPSDPLLFRVRGEHAHAWPEVFFAGVGWVSFEPTPGRGQPFAQDYTGAPVAQAATADPTTATTSPVPAAGDPSAPIPDGSSQPQSDDGVSTTDVDQAAQSGDGLLARLIGRPLQRALPIVALALAGYLLLVPLALVAHRRLRRQRAHTPLDRIALAWTEVTEAAALVGYRERRSDTFDERSERLGGVLPEAGDTVRTLAHRAERAVYSAEGADDLDAELADEARSTLVAAALAAAPWQRRVRRWVDPRGALRTWRQGRRLANLRVTASFGGNRAPRRVNVSSGRR